MRVPVFETGRRNGRSALTAIHDAPRSMSASNAEQLKEMRGTADSPRFCPLLGAFFSSPVLDGGHFPMKHISTWMGALVVCGFVLVAVVSRPITHVVPSPDPNATRYVEVTPKLIPIAAADREAVYKQMEEAWRTQAKEIRLAMTKHPEKREAYQRVLEVIEANLAAVRRHMQR